MSGQEKNCSSLTLTTATACSLNRVSNCALDGPVYEALTRHAELTDFTECVVRCAPTRFPFLGWLHVEEDTSVLYQPEVKKAVNDEQRKDFL